MADEKFRGPDALGFQLNSSPLKRIPTRRNVIKAINRTIFVKGPRQTPPSHAYHNYTEEEPYL